MESSDPASQINRFNPTARSMLWHYARGLTPNFLDGACDRVGWCSYTHRAIQPLNAIRIAKKKRPYVFTNRFEFRIDTAFERVVSHCGDPARDSEGITWLGAGLVRSFLRLHELGFAHSFEAWRGGELVGGWFGLRLGRCVTCESMFHLEDGAGTFAYVRGLLHLREQGFAFVDVNFLSPHFERWGAGWVPHWRFLLMLREALRAYPSARPGQAPGQPLPLGVRLALAGHRLARIPCRALIQPLKGRRSRRTKAPVTEPIDLLGGIRHSSA